MGSEVGTPGLSGSSEELARLPVQDPVALLCEELLWR
jgi:hypothetical protein